MKFIVFASLVSIIITLILANPVNHHRNVRDLFVTTGWGGAGLPYSNFYITGKQLKEIRNDYKKRNVDDNPEILSLVECVKCAGKAEEKTEKQTVPQLFSSSGWGPLGRRRR